MDRWQIVLIEIGLACLCGAMAFVGLLETLSCLNEGQLTEPAVCKSGSVESSYFCGLAIGAAVGVLGVIMGHFRHRWRTVLIATGVSLIVLTLTLAWGLRSVPIPQY